MFRKLVAALLLLCSIFPNLPASAYPLGVYSAVICSQDLKSDWFDKRRNPSFTVDHLVVIREWDDLDEILDRIVTQSCGRPIFLDFFVHGYDCLQIRSGFYYATADNASMGYVLNHVKRKLAGHKFVLCFESCFAGKAYHDSIRGMVAEHTSDNVEDFAGIPEFPVLGAGPNFSTIGPIMYLQYVHSFRNWWEDLRQYDSKGENVAVPPDEEEIIQLGPHMKVSVTTYAIAMVVSFFRNFRQARHG